MLRSTLIALMAAGCSDYATSEMAGDFADTASSGDYDEDGDADADADGDTDTDSENEDDYMKLAPAATDAYVFVANPGRDTVTRIAVSDLAVLTTEVGHIPSTVQTTSDYSLAITLDEGDDSVTVIAAETMEAVSVEIRDNMNSLSLSPAGDWAMTWYDPDKESLGDSNGVVSFNEVSFIRLDPPTHVPMAVGYNPKGVRWSDDGKLAIVVSDGSLSVVDLTAATPSPTRIMLAEDELDAPVAEEVVLTPDGLYAFVRQREVETLQIVDLAAGTVTPVDVGEDPTDMDVTPDGQRLAVVARSARQIWSYDVDDPFATPSLLDFPSDTAWGAVSFAHGGDTAILYTSSALVASLAVWDTTTDLFDERSLIKPVKTIALSPVGDVAMVFHTKEDAEDTDPSEEFYNEWAVTLMETDGLGENRMVVEAEPTGYSVTDDDRWGFYVMEGVPTLEALSFESLLPEHLKLASDPVFVGTLPGRTLAWTSQQHELGRISFYDPDADELNTITGFELNSDIEH